MRHIPGSEIFAPDDATFRRRVIDSDEGGPVRSYAYYVGGSEDSNEHCHSKAFELFLVFEGEGTVVVEGKDVPLRKGDVLILDPGEFHYVRRTDKPFYLLAVVAPNFKNPSDSLGR